MSAPPLMPVFASKTYRAWPRSPEGGAAMYQSPAIALQSRYATDAHVAGYYVPSVPRRLDGGAPGHPVDGAPLVVAMAFLIIDLDGPDHQAPPAWRSHLAERVERALAEHPGGFSYETRGGGRLVWRRAAPFVITTESDARTWKLTYWRTLLYLSRRYGLVGDPSCADWTRLYRAPHATREPGGKPEQLPTVGDPELGTPFAFDPSEADLHLDLAEARRLYAAHPPAVGEDGQALRVSPWGAPLRALEALVGVPLDQPPLPLSSSTPRPRRPPPEERQRLWCESALDKLASELARAGRGGRNNAARDAALILGHYAPHLLDPGAIERALLRACEANGLVRDDGHAAALATLRRAISDGMREPKRPELGEEPRPRGGNPQPAPGVDPRKLPIGPVIEISADLPGNIDAAITALVACPDLYTRGTSLAQVVLATDPEHPEGEGVPVLRALPKATLREMLCRVATWQRVEPRGHDGPGAHRAAIPGEAIVQGVSDRGRWPGLRPILGIARTPFLRRDGSVCDQPGYDKASGYVLVCSEPFPSVPDRPSLREARAALDCLLDLFCDFPFVDEPSRHVPLAALLTLLALPALGGANVPAFLFDATTPGTGKSLLLDVVCILATGREVPKSSWREDEEMAKVFGAAALEGASVLAFDNISPEIPFGGSAVELVLTCSGQYKPRILGRSEIPTLPWRAVLLATGNNVSVRGDTRRRVLLSRQQTTLERPEERDDFKYPWLRETARQRRGALVGAALTLLRAHAVAGRPAAVRRIGSFETWGAMVASALAWAGGANVLDAMPRPDTADDPILSSLRVLLEAWPLFDPTGHGLRLGALADKLYPFPRRFEDAPEDDGLGHVREAVELLAPAYGGGRVRVDVRRLGAVLRAHRERNLGGWAFQEGAMVRGSRTWRVIDPVTREPRRFARGT
jgi:hypothetical protein